VFSVNSAHDTSDRSSPAFHRVNPLCGNHFARGVAHP
jgi:hypothetical protein